MDDRLGWEGGWGLNMKWPNGEWRLRRRWCPVPEKVSTFFLLGLSLAFPNNAGVPALSQAPSSERKEGNKGLQTNEQMIVPLMSTFNMPGIISQNRKATPRDR